MGTVWCPQCHIHGAAEVPTLQCHVLGFLHLGASGFDHQQTWNPHVVEVSSFVFGQIEQQCLSPPCAAAGNTSTRIRCFFLPLFLLSFLSGCVLWVISVSWRGGVVGQEGKAVCTAK